MKLIYIAPDFNAQSGVSAYARNFFKYVLKPEGFNYLEIKSLNQFEQWISLQKEPCRYHLEIAVGTHLERLILNRIIKTDSIIDITLHDPPYIAFPYYRTSNRLLNQLSKLLQIILPQQFFGLSQMRRIRRIFTLSERGRSLTAAVYPGANVCSLPFICVHQPVFSMAEPLSLVYTGFIGKKKGLDYVLRLHHALLGEFPKLILKVVGTPLDSISKNYFDRLKKKYTNKVEYLGYVDDQSYIKLLSAGHVVILPTLDYGTICPVSANILDALLLGSVVVSTRANANTELIMDGSNGFFLSGDFDLDVSVVEKLLIDPELRQRLIFVAQSRLSRDHSPQRLRALLRASWAS